MVLQVFSRVTNYASYQASPGSHNRQKSSEDIHSKLCRIAEELVYFLTCLFKVLLLSHGSLVTIVFLHSVCAESGFWVQDLSTKRMYVRWYTRDVVSKHNHKPTQAHQTLRVSLTRSTDRLCKQTFQGPISVNGGASSCPSAWQSSWNEGSKHC